jgi:hypothetical protein
VDLGAAGRPVVGKVSVPAGYENKVPLKTDKVHFWEISARWIEPLDLLGGINPDRHGMPLPPGWHGMSPRQQSAYRRAWDRSPAGIAYRRVMFPDDVGLIDGGTFRFDALRPGRYSLSLRSLEMVRDQNMLEDTAGFGFDFTVPAPPAGQKVTDQAVDLGTIALKPVPRIVAGDKAPPFQVATPDGKPVRLDDYKGKFLVLQVRWPHLPDHETPALKKAYDAFAHDPRFAMLTVHIRAGFPEAKIDPALKWTQAYGTPQPESQPNSKPSLLSPTSWFAAKPTTAAAEAIPAVYLQGPASIFLIGPNGTLITKILKGDDVETALAKALLERK